MDEDNQGNVHNQHDVDEHGALGEDEAVGNFLDGHSTYYGLQLPETTCSVQHSCFEQLLSCSHTLLELQDLGISLLRPGERDPESRCVQLGRMEGLDEAWDT